MSAGRKIRIADARYAAPRRRPYDLCCAVSGLLALLAMMSVAPVRAEGSAGAAANRTSAIQAPPKSSAVPVAALPSAEPVVVGVDVQVDGPVTRLVFTASAPLSGQSFALEGPDRLVIDMPQVVFRLQPEAGRAGKGLIRAFRFGQFSPGRSRVVIDLAGPAVADALHAVPLASGFGHQVTLALRKASRDEFRRLSAAPAVVSSSPEPQAIRSQASRLPLIVIDPGHGGLDPGAATPGGVLEKDITLAFAEALKAEFERAGDVEVALTRHDDRFVALGARVQVARDRQAALFLSLHADTLGSAQQVRGATVYTSSERASDADAARLAEKENRVDALAGLEGAVPEDDVADILFDLTRRETRVFSNQFARDLVAALGPHLTLNKNALRTAPFRVLRAHDVPSVLIELGYLSSGKDLESLLSPAWRARAAQAVAGSARTFVGARGLRAGIAPQGAALTRREP